MNVIQLRLIVPAPARREFLRRVFGADSELAVVSHETDIERGDAPDVFVVDLATPEATLPWFWMMLHIRYPLARFMAVTDLPIDEAALQAALHAGAHTILTWADPAAQAVAASPASVTASPSR
jgi:DNA-binding NarL/FixJ family response regulator